MSHRFRAAVESGDAASLSAALRPDVVFHSPAVFTPYVGRDATMQVLEAVLRVFEDFQYVSEITTGDEQVLRFVATVAGKTVEGVDVIKYDSDGLVADLTVMIRPLSALRTVVDAMGKQLAVPPDAERTRPH